MKNEKENEYELEDEQEEERSDSSSVLNPVDGLWAPNYNNISTSTGVVSPRALHEEAYEDEPIDLGGWDLGESSTPRSQSNSSTARPNVNETDLFDFDGQEIELSDSDSSRTKEDSTAVHSSSALVGIPTKTTKTKQVKRIPTSPSSTTNKDTNVQLHSYKTPSSSAAALKRPPASQPPILS